MIHFGPYQLDRAQGLRRGSTDVRITPKSLALLCVLAERTGEVVTKEELFHTVWPDASVSDSALTTCIRELRHVLGDTASRPRFIETLHRRGYRFLAQNSSRVAGECHKISLPSVRTGAPLIGREPVFEEMVATLARAEQGSRQVLFVTEMLDHVRKGRDAYAHRAWYDAYQAFLLADEATPLEAADLERLATAAYLIDREQEFQRFIERLHRVHLEADNSERAARCAFWLALSFLFRGDVGQSNAWTRRGYGLVQDRDCVERGYMLTVTATQQLHGGHVEQAQEMATEAAAIGERCHDADLTAAARHLQGRACIHQGQVAPGLKFLDETMLAVVAGELSPIMTGLMYCAVIEACREVHEVRRAREWTFALSRWCEQQSEMVAFTGVCLVHRAEIMQFHGAWPEALAEACRACTRSQQNARKPPSAALYQQAEIYRLRGECAKAEEAYRDASRLGYDPQPGLALLRLAQGRIDAASAGLRRLLIATTNRLQRARLLPAYLEIVLEAGEFENASNVCEELQALAEALDTDVLRAVAAQAQGGFALGRRDARAALAPLRRAFEMWGRLEAPYERARARVLIGHACQALGDEEGAELEFDAARSVFAQLGAQPDLDRLDSARSVTSSPGTLTARELEVLRLIASGHRNKAIAAELCLSERTIDRHVSNILSKLDVPSRTAATAYACAHKLI